MGEIGGHGISKVTVCAAGEEDMTTDECKAAEGRSLQKDRDETWPI